jgi:hypothetical protein
MDKKELQLILKYMNDKYFKEGTIEELKNTLIISGIPH